MSLHRHLNFAIPSPIPGLVVSDLDGTVVDCRQRFAMTESFAERDQLLKSVCDVWKPEIVCRLRALQAAGYALLFLSGRCDSYWTRKQLDDQFESYVYVRNSSLYNPTRSSTLLKTEFFRQLLSDREVCSKLHGPIMFFDDRLDIVQAVSKTLGDVEATASLELLDDVYISKIHHRWQCHHLESATVPRNASTSR